jgi:hypothetical protein
MAVCQSLRVAYLIWFVIDLLHQGKDENLSAALIRFHNIWSDVHGWANFMRQNVKKLRNEKYN